MPELPEVETIVNDLEKVLPGLKIRDVWTDLPAGRQALKKHTGIAHPTGFKAFKKEIIGKKILRTERKGKNILIHLSGNTTLLVHQKMTGHLLYGKWEIKNGSWESAIPGPLREDKENRFIHLLFFLSNGRQLALCDMRKFAKVLLWETDKLTELKDIRELGPDPFDKSLTLKKFKERLRGSRAIKQVLMDPKTIAGIGNIYADEILWKADVHPAKETNKLKEEEIKKIYASIKPILKRAIKARGSSYIDYRDAFGEKGRYQQMHYAYQMTGTKCLKIPRGCKKKDGGIIKKIKIGSRSAHFCEVHQRL